MLTLYDDVFSPYARKGTDRALREGGALRAGPSPPRRLQSDGLSCM